MKIGCTSHITPGITDITIVDGQGGLECLDLIQQAVDQLERRWLCCLQWCALEIMHTVNALGDALSMCT